jgi:glycosyltransferase involved in cell wall biosynthesis
MKQWRILHSESSRGWGGQEVRVMAELEWMRAHGHWVALAAHPQSEIFRRAGEAGIERVPLRFHKALLPLEVYRLALWLGSHRVDVVNTHSSNDGWLAGLAARLTGRTLIRSRHIEVDYPNRFLSGLAFRALPHYVITTSKRIADRLVAELGVPSKKVTCIATGVDLTRFAPDAVKTTLRAEMSLPPGTALVGMVSVLRSWKGHATLLEAARLLIDQGRMIHFAIAGEGTMRVVLPDQIDKAGLAAHVTLLGHRADVPNVLAALDVLVLPSYAHEGIPQIILQAQAMKCPVVATRIGGIPEVVQEGVTGLLVEPKDAAALAGAIATVLDDKALAGKLTQAGRQQIEQAYSLDAMGERLLRLYAGVSHTGFL